MEKRNASYQGHREVLVKMGKCFTKQVKEKEERKKILGTSLKKFITSPGRWSLNKRHSFRDKEEKRDIDLQHLHFENNKNSEDEEPVQTTTMAAERRLKKLQMESPPGFEKFDSEVDWQTIDPEISLKLWEDVFKPLYTFPVMKHFLEDSG